MPYQVERNASPSRNPSFSVGTLIGALALSVWPQAILAQDCAPRTNSGSQAKIVVSSRLLETGTSCEIWLRRGEQLLVEIDDANEIVYRYGLQSFYVPDEPLPAGLVSFLSATRALPPASVPPQPGQMESQGEGRASNCASRDSTRTLPEWGACLKERARLVRQTLEFSDLGRNDSGQVISAGALAAQVAERAKGTTGPAMKGDAVSLSESWTQFEILIQAAIAQDSTPRKLDLVVLYAEMQKLYPEAAKLNGRLEQGAVTPRQLIASADSTAPVRIVRLVVTARLEEAYTPRRFTTGEKEGINIAVVRMPARRLAVSYGLSWTPFPKQYSYTTTSTVGDTVFVDANKRDPLTPVPTTLFTLRSTVRNNTFLGLSALVGLRIAEGGLTIGEAVDYGVVATLGLNHILISAGAVWRWEVDAESITEDDDLKYYVTKDAVKDLESTRQLYFAGVLSYFP